ncbi:hypothetical protein M1614_03400 [Candidatus Marsarchaeota archaeon]|nr:hypothetical protein [Candidatus Marsarchaeota archaeon]
MKEGMFLELACLLRNITKSVSISKKSANGNSESIPMISISPFLKCLFVSSNFSKLKLLIRNSAAFLETLSVVV